MKVSNDKEKKTSRLARMKERKRREAEQRAEKLKKDHLMREIKLGALNTKRYRTLWREMMIRIKMPQIVEDVEIAWHNFERALDIKDYRSACISFLKDFFWNEIYLHILKKCFYFMLHRISLLMDELAEAEEQYQKNIRSHAETIDCLLRMYAERMDREDRNYRKILNNSLDQMDHEINEIHYQQNEDEILLHSITRGIELQLEESLNNIKSITLSIFEIFSYMILFMYMCDCQN